MDGAFGDVQGGFLHRLGERRMGVAGAGQVLGRAAELHDRRGLGNHLAGLRRDHVDAEDAVRRRRAVLAALRPSAGERVVDIGTGPGFVARELADAVGPGGHVLAVDTSEPMLALARRRCADAAQVRVEIADAIALPANDASFDAAVSVQVYEYIAEVGVALTELHRVLRPGGRAAVVSSDWTSLVWQAGDEGRMRRILDAFSEHCAHQQLPRTLGPRLRAAGFTIAAQQVLPQFNPVFGPETFSGGLCDLVSRFVERILRLTFSQIPVYSPSGLADFVLG